jgi:hypothetical protein
MHGAICFVRTCCIIDVVTEVQSLITHTRIMKYLIGWIVFGSLVSCGYTKNMALRGSKVERIEILQGLQGRRVQVKEEFEQTFMGDLSASKQVSPTKYIKSHIILISYTGGDFDTILTNGSIHQLKNWYRSDVDLLEKYTNNEQLHSDTVTGQWRTAEKLQKWMLEKRYDEAIGLFSAKRQREINLIKENPGMFFNWCMAWTLDEGTFKRYMVRIEAGKGIFVFEDNQWKIDEK